MTGTVTKNLIGEQDINRWDGVAKTFTRQTSMDYDLTILKFGYEVDALVSYGGSINYTSETINAAIAAVGTTDKIKIVLRPGEWVLTEDISIPDNVYLVLVPGAYFSGAGIVTGMKEVRPEYWGAVGDGVTDDTAAVQKALTASVGRTLFLGERAGYRFTSGLQAPLAGSYHIKGMGAVYNSSIVPGAVQGSCLIWDGDDDETMIDLGGGPLYINGVYQPGTAWQNNTTIEDFSIYCSSGAKSLIYAHSQDNFTARRIFVNGNERTDIRGAFDIRGTMSQPILEGNTIYGISKGYGFRLGDGACWARLLNNAVQKTALCYWIGDTPCTEKPWAVRGITFDNSSIEGSVIVPDTPAVKFSITAVNGSHAAGLTHIAVADGSKAVPGDTVFIGRGDNNFEMNTVTTIVGNTWNLVYPLEFNHATTERVAVGTIGIHIGGSDIMQTINVSTRKVMYNWVGCGVDAHHIDGLVLDEPDCPSKCKRLIYLDGNWLNVTLKDPHTCNFPQDADYKLLEITDATVPGWFFTWFGRLDRSGMASPYQIDQTEFDGVYFGNDAIEGINVLPPKFRMFQSDYTGLVLRETTAGAGFRYVIGPPGSPVTILNAGPEGTLTVGVGGVLNLGVDALGGVYARKQITLLSNLQPSAANNNSFFIDEASGRLCFKMWNGTTWAVWLGTY